MTLRFNNENRVKHTDSKYRNLLKTKSFLKNKTD